MWQILIEFDPVEIASSFELKWQTRKFKYGTIYRLKFTEVFQKKYSWSLMMGTSTVFQKNYSWS